MLSRDEPQWALAKFAYGLSDDDLKDEEVDVWVMRGCATWERLATAETTEDDGTITWLEGNYSDYVDDLRRRKGADADQPHRVKYKRLDA